MMKSPFATLFFIYALVGESLAGPLGQDQTISVQKRHFSPDLDTLLHGLEHDPSGKGRTMLEDGSRKVQSFDGDGNVIDEIELPTDAMMAEYMEFVEAPAEGEAGDFSPAVRSILSPRVCISASCHYDSQCGWGCNFCIGSGTNAKCSGNA